MGRKEHRDNPQPGKHGVDEPDKPHGGLAIPDNSSHHGVTIPRKVKKKKRNRKRSTGRPHGRLNSRASFRYRTKDKAGQNVHLGSWYRNYSTGKILYADESHNNYPYIERMWDHTHPLVRPVLHEFRPNKYSGIRKIYGKPTHTEGGPLMKLICFTGNSPEVQGIDTYDEDHFWAQFPGGFYYSYEGGFVPATWTGYSQVDFLNAGNSGPLGPDYESPEPYGAAAYDRARPSPSNTTGIMFLQDMAELPRQLATTAKGMHETYLALGGKSTDLFMPKSIGDHFLNHVFGWSPFIGDCLELYKRYQDQDQGLADIARANNQWVKKAGTLLKESKVENDVTTTSDTAVKVYPPLLSGLYRPASQGPFEVTRTYTNVERHVWYDGSFKFYVPEFEQATGATEQNRASSGLYGQIMRRVKYYGLSISPSSVYQLTPWTWLGDWFSNAGHVVNNVTATIYDRLVSRWFYVMCHTQKVLHQDSTLYLRTKSKSLNWVQSVESKRRAEGHPFGFNLSPQDITPMRGAILAALALTH